MNYAEIKHFDIANGVGVRTTLFVSGCRNHCPGCFNEETWSFDFGEVFSREVEDRIVEELKTPYVDGLSVLGGEPLEPEIQRDLAPFLERVRAEVPNTSIWLWSGFTWEQLTSPDAGACRARVSELARILDCLDVLVDGPFLLDKRDITLRFRGSPNQRILDVPASLEAGAPVEWHDEKVFATRSW